MKRIILALVLVLAFSSLAMAETWVAACNDGQHVQYNQTVNGNGFLYLTGTDGRTLQIAKLEQTFFNGTAICGTVIGNGTGNSGEPITQVCANKSRNTIYIKYKHPFDNTPINSSEFCSATVRVN